MKKIAILLLVVLILPGCEDEHESVSIDEKYFPLHVGDSWEYVAYTVQAPPQPGMKREITSIVSINNRQYYLMTTLFESSGHVDTTYYRVDHKGYVYARRNDQDKEANPFRLSTPDGTSWKSATNLSPDGLITLDQFTTVQLNQTTVDSCKIFSYNAENLVDEEYYTTLGPGLGIVTQGSYAWGGRFDLKKAVINGKTLEF